MRFSFLLGLLLLLSGCAHARLHSAAPGTFTLACNDCSESDWRYEASRYCTVKPKPDGQRTITGMHSQFIKYRPVKTRTYRCNGQIIRHP